MTVKVQGLGVRATRTAALSINDSTDTALQLDSEVYDTDGMFTVNDDFITIQRSGIYIISACARFSPNATGMRRISVAVGGTPIAAQGTDNIGATDKPMLSLVTAAYLGKEDSVAFKVYQTSGGALNIEASSPDTPVISLQYIGPAQLSP
jgi:hypothetical protein